MLFLSSFFFFLRFLVVDVCKKPDICGDNYKCVNGKKIHSCVCPSGFQITGRYKKCKGMWSNKRIFVLLWWFEFFTMTEYQKYFVCFKRDILIYENVFRISSSQWLLAQSRFSRLQIFNIYLPKRSEFCWMIPETKSRRLFNNLH